MQLYSDVTSVNSGFVPDKIIKDSDTFRIKCLPYSKISAILYMYSLFCVFTLFYLILENMSTIVRKFCFPCYIWHYVTSFILCPFLCCHLLYLIIYLREVEQDRMGGISSSRGCFLLFSDYLVFFKWRPASFQGGLGYIIRGGFASFLVSLESPHPSGENSHPSGG